MKLLFDENLSPKLPLRLNDLFPNSLHVRDVGMKAAIDPVIWDYAKDNNLIIVSKQYTYQLNFYKMNLNKSNHYLMVHYYFPKLQILKYLILISDLKKREVQMMLDIEENS